MLLKPKQLSLTIKSSCILSLLCTGTFLLSGCLFGGDSHKPGSNNISVKVEACKDLAPAQQKTADSIVVLATDKMTQDWEFMFGPKSGSWDSVKARDPSVALKLYDQALVVAPGHCGATFGRAIASAMTLNRDPKLDQIVKKMDAQTQNESGSTTIIGSTAALFKMTPDKAMPILLKTSANMANFDYPTVTEFQSLIETSFMPKLDEMIASLEAAMNYENFTFEFTNENGKTFQLDQGEIGPVLAGLKVGKAWMNIVAGYQWEVAVGGKYAWATTYGNIREEDFDHLTTQQTEALDYIKNLFTTNSSFSKIKPDWKGRVKGIPALLLSAVSDAQKGLQYAIKESTKQTGQEKDLYVVGIGLDADVDPADLQKAIDLLERSKKYLTGDVDFTYNNGVHTLKVNFPKIFEIDGIQSQFPYFSFYPYNEWNDAHKADTAWTTYEYGIQTEVYKKLNYVNDYELMWSSYQPLSDSINITVSNIDTAALQVGMPYSFHTILATIKPVVGQPCSYTYQKYYDRVAENGGISDPNTRVINKSVPNKTSGTFTVAGCRVVNGTTEYVSYVDKVTKGPIYFTDASGKKTIDISDLEKYSDDIPALETKIIFRDPTFGGVLPEMTQAKIWNTIKSFETIKTSVKRTCSNYAFVKSPNVLNDPQLSIDSIVTLPGDTIKFYYYSNYSEPACKIQMPENPSDLDLIASGLLWMRYLY